VSHNKALRAEGKVLYKAFVILAVDSQGNHASGCSVDSSVRFLKSLEEKYELDLFDRLRMAYLDGDNLSFIHINEIDNMYKSGRINDKTTVFNNLVNTNYSLNNQWKTQFLNSPFFRFVE
jgi:hypothetical protein